MGQEYATETKQNLNKNKSPEHKSSSMSVGKLWVVQPQLPATPWKNLKVKS